MAKKVNVGVGLSYEEIQSKSARRVFELQSKWKNRDAKEFRGEYDLEKRVKLAWATRQEIREKILKQDHSSADNQNPFNVWEGAYSMFFSRHIDYEKADAVKAVVMQQCHALNINVIGSGGGLEAPISEFVLTDVKIGIRCCETLLAVVTPRREGDSNIWIVSEVAMALALNIPVVLAIHRDAKSEHWNRLGGGYREIKWDENDFESKSSRQFSISMHG